MPMSLRCSGALVAASVVAVAVIGAAPANAAPVPKPTVRVAAVAAAAPRPAVVAATQPTVRATATSVAPIRATGAAKGVVLATLDAGQRIPTTGPAVKGWVPVRYRSTLAYVSAKRLVVPVAGTPEPARPENLSATGTKIATAALVVRSGPSKSAAKKGRIAEGAALTLTGAQRGGYVPTVVAKQTRWVSVRYLASQAPAQTALDFARAQLGKPYKFGATGPTSYDCSGLTLSSWKAAGVTIPRTAAQQAKSGTKIKKSQLQPGDLVFFYGRTPSHVAMFVGDGLVIHSPRPGKTVQYIKMSYMPYSSARRPG